MRDVFEIISKIPLYQSFRAFGYPKMLPENYTFLISTICNSRCATCNIWKQKYNDLTLAEWKKVFRSIGKSPFWVTISGGEPFIQEHLADMVIAIDRICKPTIINIPTNSLLVEKINTQVIKILKNIKTPKFIVNLSLDGVGKVHDKVRGVPGNFEKVMENYKNLKNIQKKYPNFSIGFGTVVSNYNLKDVKKVIDLVFKLEPDQYLTEIAEERVELDTVGQILTPSYKEYSKAVNYLLIKMQARKFRGIGKVSRAFRFEYYQFVKDWLRGKKLIPDYAGFASCEVTSFGEVWPSCIKGENMGNIRNANYDFSKVWFSDEAKRIRKDIKKYGSSYPLANAFYSSSLHHYQTLIKVLWKILIP